jgi:hypothetical protein
MAEFSRKEASGAVILLIYMSAKLHGLRDNEIIYRSSARCPRDPGFPSLSRLLMQRRFGWPGAVGIIFLPVRVTWGVDRPIMKKTLCFGLFFCVTTAFFSATAATGCEDHIHPYIDCSRARTTEQSPKPDYYPS